MTWPSRIIDRVHDETLPTDSTSPIRYAVAVVLAGIIAGVVGGGLVLILDVVEHVVWGASGNAGFIVAVTDAAPVKIVLVLAAAGLLGAVVWFLLSITGHPPVSVDTGIKNGDMPLWRTFPHAIVQTVIVAMGASIGKEVAPRELSAAIANWMSRRLGLSGRDHVIIMACAAGAGLGAVYSVPFAGMLFALEVFLADFRVRTVVTAAVVSGIAVLVSSLFGASAPYYHVAQVHTGWNTTWWAMLVGPVIGFASYWFGRGVTVLKPFQPKRGWLFASMPLTFAAVGVVAIWMPEVLGNGGLVGQRVFASDATIGVLLLMALVKALTTLATIGAGTWGGTLQPSVAIGAALGAGLGLAWGLIVPGVSPIACAFIGAAAFLARSQKAPLTALVLMLEFTDLSVSIMLPTILAIAGSMLMGMGLDRAREHRVARLAPSK